MSDTIVERSVVLIESTSNKDGHFEAEGFDAKFICFNVHR